MPTLQEALRGFLRVERSPYTNKQYRNHLTRLVTAIGPQRDVQRVTYDDLSDFLALLRGSPRPPKATTLRAYLGIWITFFNWCIDEQYLSRSPARHFQITGPTQEPGDRAIPTATLNAMVEVTRPYPRDFAILLFMIDTGARVGGVESLSRQRLNLDEGTALLLEKGSKWHAVYFGELTTAALRAWLALRPSCAHDYVFTTTGKAARHLTRVAITNVVRRAARRIGAEKIWTGHAIRHAVGHAYADAEVPIWITQKKLGHSRQETTGRYYPDGERKLREATRRLPLAPLRDLTAADPANIIPFSGRTA